jgi:nucleoside permease NupC
VFGLALLLSFSVMAARPAEGAILALAFSVVLLAFGALPGLIAGIIGLVGALTGIVRNLRFHA